MQAAARFGNAAPLMQNRSQYSQACQGHSALPYPLCFEQFLDSRIMAHQQHSVLACCRPPKSLPKVGAERPRRYVGHNAPSHLPPLPRELIPPSPAL
jgi:hypothetical protein